MGCWQCKILAISLMGQGIRLIKVTQIFRSSVSYSSERSIVKNVKEIQIEVSRTKIKTIDQSKGKRKF